MPALSLRMFQYLNRYYNYIVHKEYIQHYGIYIFMGHCLPMVELFCWFRSINPKSFQALPSISLLCPTDRVRDSLPVYMLVCLSVLISILYLHVCLYICLCIICLTILVYLFVCMCCVFGLSACANKKHLYSQERISMVYSCLWMGFNWIWSHFSTVLGLAYSNNLRGG